MFAHIPWATDGLSSDHVDHLNDAPPQLLDGPTIHVSRTHATEHKFEWTDVDLISWR
jgi:hypothetical protein